MSEEPQVVYLTNEHIPFWKVALSAAAVICVLAVGFFVTVKVRMSQDYTPNDSVTANAAECASHVTVCEEVELTHDVYAGSHTYVSEIRYDKYGVPTEITSTCYMRSIGTRYEYRCVYCGKVTSSGTSAGLTHSSCGQ